MLRQSLYTVIVYTRSWFTNTSFWVRVRVREWPYQWEVKAHEPLNSLPPFILDLIYHPSVVHMPLGTQGHTITGTRAIASGSVPYRPSAAICSDGRPHQESWHPLYSSNCVRHSLTTLKYIRRVYMNGQWRVNDRHVFGSLNMLVHANIICIYYVLSTVKYIL